MKQIWDIHGGIHPPENKHQSTGTPIRPAGLPELLVLPLSQHIGAPAAPVVAEGEQVLKGQLIASAKGTVSVPLHAPTSGEIVAIEPRPVPHPSGMSAPCLVLRPDGREQWCERQPLEHWRELERSELLRHLAGAGIAGMGGAGFPTAVKLGPREDKPIDTLIINAAECEPYITADDMLMRERAGDIVAGVEILRHILQPSGTTLIGIEDNKPEAIEALRAASRDSDLEVVVFPTKYPSGGEKQLIEILTGRQVPSGGLPADIGVVCQNVGTAAAVSRAVYAGEPLIQRITTVTGEACAQPGNFEVLLGTPIRHLLEQCGFDAERCSRLVIGGPMMGYAVDSPEVPVVKTTNCVLAPSVAEQPPPDPAQPCIRCGMCSEACPASLLPQQLYWFARGQEWDKLEEHNLFDCIECGACSYVCPSHIPLVQYYRAAKGDIRKQQQEKAKAEHAKARFEARQERIAREEAEKERRRQQRQQAARAASPKDGDPIQAAVERARAKKAAAQGQQKDREDGQAAPSAGTDAASAAIERARAQRAAGDGATADPIERLKQRLETARGKLAQAQEQGSDQLQAFEQSVHNLEQKLEQARARTTTPERPDNTADDPAAAAIDPAAASIEKARKQRAQHSDQSSQDKALGAVSSLEQRLDKARAKLEQARSEGSEQVPALEQAAQTLEQKLARARGELSALESDNRPVPAPVATEPEDPAQAAIARAQAKRAGAAQLSPADKLQQQIHSLRQRLDKNREQRTRAEREGSEHAQLLTETGARLEDQLREAERALAELETRDA